MSWIITSSMGMRSSVCSSMSLFQSPNTAVQRAAKGKLKCSLKIKIYTASFQRNYSTRVKINHTYFLIQCAAVNTQVGRIRTPAHQWPTKPNAG